MSWLKLCIPVATLTVAGSALSDASPAGTTPQPAVGTKSDVIVILRDQLENVPPARHAMAARTAAITAAQAPVLAELEQSGTHKIRSFSLINAFATSLSAAEAARLAADPAVRAVVPDAVIHAPRPQRETRSGGVSAAAKPSAIDASKLCGTLEPQALQLMHAAFKDPTEPQAQQLIDGNGELVRGKGVKVAYLADGLDTTIAGFTRHDGSPVFIDYKNFSGDPSTAAMDGGEAFGDASSIAAQDDPKGTPLKFDISKFVNESHPLPSPCNIRIRGVAPGVSLVGLDVFSNALTPTSNFVQAIDYAVTVDDVDVINESFGGNPLPDTANDPISLADSAAVRAGVTVVVSSGDAGSAGTLGSPSTDTDVISAGASTQFRFYAQTGYYALPLAKGYLSDNISSLSSGGFAQGKPRTVDVVAPGDLSWALCSTNVALYGDCENFKNIAGATPIESFGGTSESAPLTSGVAALVIQAYRSTHAGASPTPAMVKHIIMSSATDLGAHPDEQGAGLVNALAAVKTALAVQDANGSPTPRGDGLLLFPSVARITDAPGTAETRGFSVTNTGSVTQHLTPVLQRLSDRVAGGTSSVTLSPTTDPTFVGVVGDTRAYVEQKFTVPAGAQHLDAAIAFQSPLGAEILVRFALLDPLGRQVAYSLPQGDSSGYGHVDVVKPTPGKWTAVIFTRASSAGYAGPVQFSWTAERRASFGSVVPATLDLAPGQSGYITASFDMPNKPGDVAAALRFLKPADDSAAAYPDIPVTLRTLIPLSSTGGAFTGTLTGGNGRDGVGPTQTFAFDVPAGLNDMNLTLQIADNGYLLEGVLVDPQGMQLSVAGNVDPSGNVQFGFTLSHANPQAGRWQFLLLQNFTSSGNQISLPFTARIGFNAAAFNVSGLPNSAATKVSASGPAVTVPIEIENTGAVTADYFADARLTAPTIVTLPAVANPGCSATKLPDAEGCFSVPTEATAVSFTAKSTVPITMDALNSVGYNIGFTGNPDLYAATIATDTVKASLSVPEVPYGAWLAFPSLIGPYGKSGAASAPVSITAQATIQSFDKTVSSDSGDIWADLTLGTSTFNPVVVAAGGVGTINLTIKPTASEVGTVVSGFVYIDTYSSVVGTGDEVVKIPYSYTVTK